MTLLKAENICKKYIRKTVLDGLNLTVKEGQIYGLMGPNASGKTTLMKIISGLTQPSSGHVEINGLRIGVNTKKIISFMPTANCLPGWMNVSRCLKFYQDMFEDFDMEKAREMVSFMGLQPEQKVSTLSTGMLGRLKLTLAVCRKAKLYVFDEPLNGLDPISREKIIEVILEAGREDSAVIISSHLINELESVIDEVIFLDNGKVALVGNTEEIRINQGKSVAELYREVYGNV